MTRRDDETPADHARRIIRERREREAAALRRVNSVQPHVDDDTKRRAKRSGNSIENLPEERDPERFSGMPRLNRVTQSPQ